MNEKVAVVVSDFNTEITHKMEKVAVDRVKELGGEVAETVHVPGVYEIPFAVKKLLLKKEVQGVITIGCAITGATDHDKIIVNIAARKIMELSLEFGKPVSLSISGPKMTRKDAIARIESYPIRAADSCIKMIRG